MDQRLNVLEPHLPHQLIEERLRQTQCDDALLGSQVVPHQCMKHPALRKLGLKLSNLCNDICRRQIRLHRVGVGILSEQAPEVDRCLNDILRLAVECTAQDHVAILQNLVEQIRSLAESLHHEGLHVGGGIRKLRIDLLQRHHKNRVGLSLDSDRINTVLAILNLNDSSLNVPHRSIILNMQILHRLHQTALDIAGVARLDSGINETLAPSLSVEERLGRHQTADKAVLNEPTTLHSVIELGEVWQSAVLQGILDTATLDELLAEQPGHLRDV